MLPDLDTHVAALKFERELALKRAERRRLVMEATKAPRSATAGACAKEAIGRWGGLLRAVRSFRWVLRPTHA
jgi:hypothetical protein